MRRTAPLILGGGPAGAAAAITLATGGARPLLIERSRVGHDTVCGGFLGWDALAGLRHLGLDPWALGAQPIDRLRIVAGARVAEARLPGRAAGLSRRTLDEALLARAADVGAGIERGVTIRRLDASGAHLADGAVLASDALFVATGKHALRGSPRVGAGGQGLVGLRIDVAATPDLAGSIELHLLADGYAGVLLQEDGSANICLSISAARLAAAGGRPDALIAALAEEAPRLAARAAGGRTAWTTIAAIPYGWRARATAPGRFRIGDQAAVIASIVGDGVALALASGRAAGEACLRGDGAADYQRRFARRAARPLRIAEIVRRAAERPRLAASLLPWLDRLPGGLRLAASLTRIGH